MVTRLGYSDAAYWEIEDFLAIHMILHYTTLSYISIQTRPHHWSACPPLVRLYIYKLEIKPTGTRTLIALRPI